jgi:hypothetical protein
VKQVSRTSDYESNLSSKSGTQEQAMSNKLKGTNQITKELADGTIKTYHYAWKGGPPLPGEPGSPEYEAAYHKAQKVKETALSSDKVWYLLREYKKSTEFHDLAPKSPNTVER